MSTLRQELFKHKDIPWIIFSPSPKELSLSPLVELIDFYNNQMLVKSLKNEKIKLAMGEKTLFSPMGLLPTDKLVVIGTGKSAVAKGDIQKLIATAEETVKNLGEKKAWMVVSQDCDEDFLAAVKKNFTSVTVG